jgi:hypothetical protein
VAVVHTNSTQNTEDGAHITIKKNNWEVNWKVLAVPRLCELYPGLTTEEKVEKCEEKVKS